eukprot:701365-Rhodomonas_salina.1
MEGHERHGGMWNFCNPGGEWIHSPFRHPQCHTPSRSHTQSFQFDRACEEPPSMCGNKNGTRSLADSIGNSYAGECVSPVPMQQHQQP